jgi:hypothetical protein
VERILPLPIPRTRRDWDRLEALGTRPQLGELGIDGPLTPYAGVAFAPELLLERRQPRIAGGTAEFASELHHGPFVPGRGGFGGGVIVPPGFPVSGGGFGTVPILAI